MCGSNALNSLVDMRHYQSTQVLRNIVQGIGILVSKFPKETASSYSLRDPDEVRRIHCLSPAALLSRATVDWKANQHKS
jgi:hypothetical protein